MTPKTKFIAFTSKDIPESDTGIKLKEMISLLKGNEFETHFLGIHPTNPVLDGIILFGTVFFPV